MNTGLNQDYVSDREVQALTQASKEISTTNSSTHEVDQKIPIVINGKILSNDKKKEENPKGPPYKQVDTHYLKPENAAHTIEVLGDSHLIDIAAQITDNLDRNYRVCGLTLPGAGMAQIVDSHEEILKNLRKSDAIVINGGSNDIGASNGKINAILKPIIHFIQRYSNTNIILINIPYRHDLKMNDKRNCIIQDYNNELKNISSSFNHVTLIETSLDWRFFTIHGFHLNKVGKEWLTRQIVGLIKQQVQIPNKDNHILNPEGKDEDEKSNENDAAIPTTLNNNPLTA
jgi:lysophospholipase L1-like esterase